MMPQNDGPPTGDEGGGRDPGAAAETDSAADGEITIENVASGGVADGDGGNRGLDSGLPRPGRAVLWYPNSRGPRDGGRHCCFT